jgi:hypothetical protein
MDAPDAEPLAFWSSDTEEADPAAWLASIGQGEEGTEGWSGGDGEGQPAQEPA